jgi:supervillin
VELNEGEETPAFLDCIQITKPEVQEWRESYSSSLLLEKPSNAKEIQLFQFSTLSGSFKATPVILRRKDDDFPILQEDLYGATQPALFLVNTGVETWLWQGNPSSGNGS